MKSLIITSFKNVWQYNYIEFYQNASQYRIERRFLSEMFIDLIKIFIEFINSNIFFTKIRPFSTRSDIHIPQWEYEKRAQDLYIGAQKDLEAPDAELLKERATLAANRVKIQYGILPHPTHSRIGEVYSLRIVENLSESAGARARK